MPGLLGIFNDAVNNYTETLFQKMIGVLSHESDYEKKTFSFHGGKYLLGDISVNIPDAPECFFRDEATGSHCVLHGEIYNYRSLWREVPGVAFSREKGDAQLALKLYEQYGEDFLRKLNGWFTLSIVDMEKDIILIANDRFGIKPSYYYHDDGMFIIAPEVKALLEYEKLDRRIDNKSLCDFMIFGCILENRTYFSRIKRLGPASKFTIRKGRLEKDRYWNWSEYEDLAPLSKKNYIEKSEEVFERIIPRYFRNNSNMVFCFTGGLDTRTIISSLSSDLYPVNTVTFGWHKNHADNYLANEISRKLGIAHYFQDSTIGDYSIENIRNMIYRCDGMSSFYGVSYDMLSSESRRFYKNKYVVQGKYGTQVLHNARPQLQVSEKIMKERLKILSKDVVKEYEAPLRFCATAATSLREIICEECRGFFYSNLTLENSISQLRTPYLDNDLIELIVQCPDDMDIEQIQANYIRTHNIDLARIPTDKGLLIEKDKLRNRLSALCYLAKSYINIIGSTRYLPPYLQLSRLPLPRNSYLKPRKLTSGYFLHKDLQLDIRNNLLNSSTLGRRLYNPERIRKIISAHFNGVSDYRKEIGQLMTVEFLFRMHDI